MPTATDQFTPYPGWTNDLRHAIIGGAPDQDHVNAAVDRLKAALGVQRIPDRSRRRNSGHELY